MSRSNRLKGIAMNDSRPAKLELHSYQFSLRGLLVPVLLILSGCGPSKEEEAMDIDNEKLVELEIKEVPNATVERLGGQVELDYTGSVVNVDLSRAKVNDGALVYLKALPKLRVLILRETQVTDAGLQLEETDEPRRA
jgi:hypothetical protein